MCIRLLRSCGGLGFVFLVFLRIETLSKHPRSKFRQDLFNLRRVLHRKPRRARAEAYIAVPEQVVPGRTEQPRARRESRRYRRADSGRSLWIPGCLQGMKGGFYASHRDAVGY